MKRTRCLLLSLAIFLQSYTPQRLGAGLYSNNLTYLYEPALPDAFRDFQVDGCGCYFE